MKKLTTMQKAVVDSVLRVLGVADNAEFVGITWARFNGNGVEDWQAKSVILTPDADPFLARAAGLTLTQEILEGNFAGLKKSA